MWMRRFRWRGLWRTYGSLTFAARLANNSPLMRALAQTTTLKALARWCPALRSFPLFLVVAGWTVVWVGIAITSIDSGIIPMDFQTYRVAAQAIYSGRDPYPSSSQSLLIWQSVHRFATQLPRSDGILMRFEELAQDTARPELHGPYLYPPTLAQVITLPGVDAKTFTLAAATSAAIFFLLWRRVSNCADWWVLTTLGSLDVVVLVGFGNVELILLLAALVAARLLWTRHPFLASPLITLTCVVKPFYLILFVSIALMDLLSQRRPTRLSLQMYTTAGFASLALGVIEVLRWGPALQQAALDFFLNSLSTQWFTLPADQQVPMSIWNRTALQGFVSAGMAPTASELAALATYSGALALTLIRIRGARPEFPVIFALGVTLLYWARPVGWGLAYMALLVPTSIWRESGTRLRTALITVACGLLLSQWWALAMTATTAGLPQITLQPAGFAWETWIVLPSSWLVLMIAVPKGVQARD
jgi:hypothetical protein